VAPLVCLLVALRFAGPYTLLLRHTVKERSNRIAFDSAAWKISQSDGTRLRMVDDLLKSHPLEGKSKEEVLALLGGPSDNSDVKQRFPDWHMHYHLGPSRQTLFFGAFDSDYLVLRLDTEGKVIAVSIVVHRT
jgi:hypothetical protein